MNVVAFESRLRKALAEVATLVTPETILGWHRKLVARKFDGSKKRGNAVGRPPTSGEIEDLVLRLARERGWRPGATLAVAARTPHRHDMLPSAPMPIDPRGGLTLRAD